MSSPKGVFATAVLAFAVGAAFVILVTPVQKPQEVQTTVTVAMDGEGVYTFQRLGFGQHMGPWVNGTAVTVTVESLDAPPVEEPEGAPMDANDAVGWAFAALLSTMALGIALGLAMWLSAAAISLWELNREQSK